MDILKKLVGEDERIASFGLTSSYCTYHCIIGNHSDDIGSALEDTLHRLIDSGNEASVTQVLGAIVPDEEKMSELEEFQEYSNLDLGYVMPGLISFFN